jgi:flagellar protein FlbD
MIAVTRLDGSELLINDDLILQVERTPDTVLTLSTGLRLLVKEPPEEIMRRVVDFRRRVFAGLQIIPEQS